jgi:hypothetical protein
MLSGEAGLVPRRIQLLLSSVEQSTRALRNTDGLAVLRWRCQRDQGSLDFQSPNLSDIFRSRLRMGSPFERLRDQPMR